MTGPLAELEDALNEDTLVSLIERFESGQVAARDVVSLIVAGLRGGGWTGTRADLLTCEIEGGPLAATQAVGALITRAFSIEQA